MGRSKKDKVENETCKVCFPKKVGLDAVGFIMFREPSSQNGETRRSFACLSHPGMVDEAVNSDALLFVRNLRGQERDGKYRQFDILARRGRGADRVDDKAMNRKVKNYIFATAGTSRKAGETPVSRPVSRETNTQDDRVKRGKGGRGDGGSREGHEDRGNGSSYRRPRDPRENLFRLDKPERTDKSTQPRKKGKGRRRTA